MLVSKKDSTLKCCVDYRHLKDLTVRDAYHIFQIEYSLAALRHTQYFSMLDLGTDRHSQWKIRRRRPSLPQSAIQVLRMPFELNNAFQRLMKLCLRDLKQEYLLIYLDNIVFFFSMFEEHLQSGASVEEVRSA